MHPDDFRGIIADVVWRATRSPVAPLYGCEGAERLSQPFRFGDIKEKVMVSAPFSHERRNTITYIMLGLHDGRFLLIKARGVHVRVLAADTLESLLADGLQVVDRRVIYERGEDILSVNCTNLLAPYVAVDVMAHGPIRDGDMFYGHTTADTVDINENRLRGR